LTRRDGDAFVPGNHRFAKREVVMREIFGRRLARLVVVSAAILAGAAGVAYATSSFASSPQATSVIQACENPGNGNLRVVANNATNCHANETALTWNVVGPQGVQGPKGDTGDTGLQGPAGTFSGTFTSPNGTYSLSVTDTGITVRGPTGQLVLNGAGVDLRSSSDLTVEASANLTVRGGSIVSVRAGGQLQLNGCSSPLPIVGSLVDLSHGVSTGVGALAGFGTILPEGTAATVCAG
jgi:hypothetical protein